MHGSVPAVFKRGERVHYQLILIFIPVLMQWVRGLPPDNELERPKVHFKTSSFYNHSYLEVLVDSYNLAEVELPFLIPSPAVVGTNPENRQDLPRRRSFLPGSMETPPHISQGINIAVLSTVQMPITDAAALFHATDPLSVWISK